MPLCFLTAFAKSRSGAITHQEYTDSLLVHLRGIRHPEDATPRLEPLANFDPWAASLRDVALADGYQPLSDTSTHSALFAQCVSGDLPAFTATLRTLRDRFPDPDVLQPAACLAAQSQRLDVLRYCVDEQGAVWDRYLTRAAQIGAKGNVPFLEYLLAKNWAGIRDDEEAVMRQIKHFGEESVEAEWLREHPGKGGAGEGKVEEKKKKSGDEGRKQGYTAEQVQGWFGDVPW